MPAQLLVGFAPGGIVPVHSRVTVWPTLVGTVTELDGGFAATLEPTAKRTTPAVRPAASRPTERPLLARPKA